MKSQETYFRVLGQMDAIKNLGVKELNKASFNEIFSSNKESIKKSINYINYTTHNHDVITNRSLPSAYTSFRGNLMKYESDFSQFDPDKNKKFLNRSPPHRNRNKKHINLNIRNIKNMSYLNKLKSLDEPVNDSIGNIGDTSNKRVQSTLNRQNNKGNFVFFKRK